MSERSDRNEDVRQYTRKDFMSQEAVRWCPGCGDYSILAQMQRVMPTICEELNLPRENIVFISGIGCSSRFLYYMNTYGFHTIHGRAPTVATGLAVSRQDLQVWVITGDGDGLSIGANHLLHCLRRNIDIKIILFNNRIYGLTKGQYSPTSEKGKKTKSSPMGTMEAPVNPIYTAMVAEATFVARAIATDSDRLREVLLRAARHRGSAFVEVLQNCNVFNDGAFDSFAEKAVMEERTLILKDGSPLVFGKGGDKVLKMRSGSHGLEFDVARLADVPAHKLVLHKEDSPRNYLARLLTTLDESTLPVPLGVFQAIDRPHYGAQLQDQIAMARKRNGPGRLFEHLRNADTWSVT